MGVITNLLLSVPIGIIYNMIVHEFADILNNKFSYKDRVQRTLLTISGGGLIGLIIAMFLLSDSSNNTAIKYGLYIGSALLLFHAIIHNWQIMQNDTRIIIMICAFFILVWYSHSSHSNKSDKYIENDNVMQLLPLAYYEKYEQHNYHNKHDKNN